MLGTRRAIVTVAAGILQRAGLGSATAFAMAFGLYCTWVVIGLLLSTIRMAKPLIELLH